MSRIVHVASLFVFVASTTAALSEAAPNLIGTWSGTITGGARFGALNHDPAQIEPVFADRKKEWVLTIDKQEGSAAAAPILGLFESPVWRSNAIVSS